MDTETPIRIKQGAEATIPTLASGEPGWTTDTKKLFLGDGATNHEIGSDAKALAASVQSGAITDGVTKAPTHDAVYDIIGLINNELHGMADGICGLNLSNAADTQHDITINSGYCRDSTWNYTFYLSSAITKQIDAAWAVGDNAGGLFSGAVGTNTFYYIFLIRKDSDGSIDAGFDTSIVAANIPAGYTAYRRIGTLRSDASSNILNGAYTGDLFTYSNWILDRAFAASPNTNRYLITISAPPNFIACLAMVISSGSGTAYGSTGPATDADVAVTSIDTAMHVTSTTHNSHKPDIKLNASSQIYARASTTNFYLGIKTLGWIDDRGRIN